MYGLTRALTPPYQGRILRQMDVVAGRESHEAALEVVVIIREDTPREHGA